VLIRVNFKTTHVLRRCLGDRVDHLAIDHKQHAARAPHDRVVVGARRRIERKGHWCGDCIDTTVGGVTCVAWNRDTNAWCREQLKTHTQKEDASVSTCLMIQVVQNKEGGPSETASVAHATKERRNHVAVSES
jgi:hypothetical protein